jgi:cellulose biosynthesis protein BcsQ
MKIAFLNQKGGVGKTTAALLVASALKAASLPVAIEDLDPQKSLTWWARNCGKVPLISEFKNAEIIISDTPGHLDLDKKGIRDKFVGLIKSADRLILVAEMSPISLHGTVPMAELILEYKKNSAKAKILFNKVRLNTLSGKQNRNEISKEIGIQALNNFLPLASAYDLASSLGWKSVTGSDRAKVVNLAMEILK